MSKPARIIMEGVSTYFEKERLRGIMQKLLKGEISIKCHNWFDHFENYTGTERLVLGHEDPTEFAHSDWGFQDLIGSTRTASSSLSIASTVCPSYSFLEIRDRSTKLE